MTVFFGGESRDEEAVVTRCVQLSGVKVIYKKKTPEYKPRREPSIPHMTMKKQILKTEFGKHKYAHIITTFEFLRGFYGVSLGIIYVFFHFSTEPCRFLLQWFGV